METDQLDPDGFRQILLGLGRNAIEASPPDGMIQLHLTQELNIIKIQISDQGHGFSSTDAAHLFDPFYCGRKAGRGLGLGLPRLARVVAQMNGRIRYRSNPGGHGSTFEVILPLPEHPRQASLSHSA
jgi:signal transduction histidine kinase